MLCYSLNILYCIFQIPVLIILFALYIKELMFSIIENVCIKKHFQHLIFYSFFNIYTLFLR
jgi:hypothetical protein